jgi:hypothetical protein
MAAPSRKPRATAVEKRSGARLWAVDSTTD